MDLSDSWTLNSQQIMLCGTDLKDMTSSEAMFYAYNSGSELACVNVAVRDWEVRLGDWGKEKKAIFW